MRQRRLQLTQQGGLNATDNKMKYEDDKINKEIHRREQDKLAAAEKIARDNAESERARRQKEREWDEKHPDQMTDRQGSRMEQLQRWSVNTRLI